MKTPALALIAALAAAPAMAQGQPTYLPLKTPEVPVPVSDAAAGRLRITTHSSTPCEAPASRISCSMLIACPLLFCARLPDTTEAHAGGALRRGHH